MFYVAARKDTQVELEKGSNNLDFTNSTQRNAFRSALCTNYGIVDSNLSLFYVAESNASVVRIRNGDVYTLTWSGGEINGADFSTEDAKRWVKVTASKTEILADNTDTTTITFELWKADKSGIAAAVTTNANVPILTPNGQRKVRVSLVNGVATKVFKTSIPGIWVAPSVTRFGNVRVWEQASIESIQTLADF